MSNIRSVQALVGAVENPVAKSVSLPSCIQCRPQLVCLQTFKEKTVGICCMPRNFRNSFKKLLHLCVFGQIIKIKTKRVSFKKRCTVGLFDNFFSTWAAISRIAFLSALSIRDVGCIKKWHQICNAYLMHIMHVAPQIFSSTFIRFLPLSSTCIHCTTKPNIILTRNIHTSTRTTCSKVIFE